MAETTLTNIVNMEGMYEGVATAVQSNALATMLLSALSVNKTADRNVWTNGELSYTITLTNGETSDYVTPVLSDILDPAVVRLVPDSVLINGTPAVENTNYTYVPATGLLTVTLPTVAGGSNATITFRVQKI